MAIKSSGQRPSTDLTILITNSCSVFYNLFALCSRLLGNPAFVLGHELVPLLYSFIDGTCFLWYSFIDGTLAAAFALHIGAHMRGLVFPLCPSHLAELLLSRRVRM